MPAKGRRMHHDERALMFVGTNKGVFVYESDFERAKWKRTGPYLGDHPIPSIAYDHRDRKTVYVATDGGGLHRTRDFGRSWEKIGRGLPTERLTHVTIGHLSEPGSIWVGGEPVMIAVSRDGGESFQESPSFRSQPSASEWRGGSGGPTVTSIVVHAASARTLHVSVDVGGVFRSDDGGENWVACTSGIVPSYPADYQQGEAHRAVHRLVSNPAKPERFYAATDTGVFRTDDGGDTWQDLSNGLSSRMTRSIIVSPSKPGTLFVVPLKPAADGTPQVQGELAVYRSIDGGERWERLIEGLPDRVSLTMHREAMVMDTLDEEGIYLATSGGQIFVSLDEGDTWTQVVSGLAPVLSLEVVTEQE